MGFCREAYDDVNIMNPKSSMLCPSCRELMKKVQKSGSFASWVYSCLSKCRHRAMKKGREFTVTSQDIYNIWPSDNCCPMLGIPFEVGGTYGKERHNSPSIDRIDNNLGYTPDNIQIVSMLFNGIKSYYSDEELDRFSIAWINSRFDLELKERTRNETRI